MLWFTPKHIARSSREKLCVSLHKVNSKAHPLASVSFSFLCCPAHCNLTCPAVCRHEFFAESPTRCKIKKKTQCTAHRCLCKTWSTQQAVLAWYIVKVLISESFFQMARVHTSSTQLVLSSTTFFLSSMRSSQTAIQPASNCLGIFSTPWRGLQRCLTKRQDMPLRIQSLPASLLIWCSHQPPCLLRQGILQPGWRDSSALFRRLSPQNLAGTVKVSWHFPPSKWAPQTWVFGVSGVFFRRIFTIHSLPCYSFAGSRWKDSSPHTVLAFCILLSRQLHKYVVWTTAYRHSERGPTCTIISSLCLLTRNKRHVRASCDEEKSNSKRNRLVEQQNREQQPNFKLLLLISAGKYPRNNRFQAFRDVTQLILHMCY